MLGSRPRAPAPPPLSIRTERNHPLRRGIETSMQSSTERTETSEAKRAPVSDPTNEAPIRNFDDLLSHFHLNRSVRGASSWSVREMEKFGVYTADSGTVHYAGDRGILRVLESLEKDHGWKADRETEGGPLIALLKDGARRSRSLSLRGAARALRRPAEDDPRDLYRAPESPPRARPHLEGARHHLAGAGLSPLRVARAARANGAEAALLDHARVSPDARRSRARHDAPHLHGAGELRLRQREGRDPEAPRRAQAVSAHDRDHGEQPLERGGAVRRRDVPLLGGCGSTWTRTGPASCRVCGRTRRASPPTWSGRSTCRCSCSSAPARRW